MLLLTACGGGGDSTAANGSPRPAAYASVRGWLDLGTNRMTLIWTDVVPDATRYQIEQQDENGAWVVIDAVWAAHGQPPAGPSYQSFDWQGIVNAPATLRVEAVTPSSTVPLATTYATYSAPATSLTFLPPAQLPSIELDQPEPLDSLTHITLGNASPGLSSALAVDVLPLPPDDGTNASVTLDPGNLTMGTHLIYAIFDTQPSGASFVISRSIQTHNSKLTVNSVDFVQNADGIDDYLLATADGGVASMVASVDDAPLETVTAPNACVPTPCAADQPSNGYHLSVNTLNLAAGSHVFAAEATDNAGNTASYRAYFNLPAPAMAALDSPLDGAVVSGTVHVSGTFSSGTPGALEVMVTLSGIPVYDKTVANTGVTTPFAADVNLAGVAPGYRALGVYTRVGNTPYTVAASIIVQVAAAP